jgi:hypothetical protein
MRHVVNTRDWRNGINRYSKAGHLQRELLAGSAGSEIQIKKNGLDELNIREKERGNGFNLITNYFDITSVSDLIAHQENCIYKVFKRLLKKMQIICSVMTLSNRIGRAPM